MRYKVLALTAFVGGCLCVPGWASDSAPELDRSIAQHRMGTLTVLAEPGLLEVSGDLHRSIARLVALPGIGAWTAQYIAMRALHEPDALPSSDLGLRRAAAAILGRKRPLTALALESEAAGWSPWRAYAAMHLWHRRGGDE